MELLWRIKRHLAATGTAPTAFGRAVANDPRLVLDMARGRVPRAPMVARIERVLGAAEDAR